MQRLSVESERGPYEILAEFGALKRLGEFLDGVFPTRPCSLVSNTTVGPLWAKAASLDVGVPLIELMDGEEHKRWSAIEELLGLWLSKGVHRGDSVIALGGGVLTDTVGFAAAVFLRGIEWTAVPTTLLAMVDAAVGGKTGVNLDQGKNLVGAFWPPRLVVIDVATLSTLPPRELRAGAAEMVKTAWIGDHQLLDIFEDRGLAGYESLPPETWQDLVMRCLAVKARVVSADEREGGQRAALNLGHTLAHALEAATGYHHLLHGEAVAWGLKAAARLGRRHSVLSVAAEARLSAAIDTLGDLPEISAIDADSIRALIGYDKKKDDHGVRWVLPTDDGVILDQRVDTDEVIEVFRELQKEG